MEEGRSSARQLKLIAIWMTGVVGAGICFGFVIIRILDGQIKQISMLDRFPTGASDDVREIGKAILACAKAHDGQWPKDATAHTLSGYLADANGLYNFVYQRPSKPLVKDTPPKQRIGYIYDGDDPIYLLANGQVLSHSKPKPSTD